MKISRYNTNTACNVPRKLSLRDPFTGELLKDDDGATLDFYIYGAHSDNARNAIKDRERKNANLTQDEAVDIGAEFLAQITQGWSGNIEDDDGPLVYSHKAAVKLYKDQDWIAQQVLNFSQNLGNYDPKRYEKSGNGSVNEPGSTVRRKAQSAQDTA
jgi:hypothetical protein